MIQRIGIIGCGKMGLDIFHFLTKFDFGITLIGKSKEKLSEVENSLNRKLKRSFSLGLIDQETLSRKLEDIKLSSDIYHLSECDLIIESITENQSLKTSLFQTLDNIVPNSGILSTNTSSIPLESLLPSAQRKGSFIGLHFFYPVAFKNIIEINAPDELSGEIRISITEFLHAIGKVPVILSRKNHFLVNRLFLRFQAGAFNICREENIPFRVMDDLISMNFFPMTVFRFFDQVGINTIHASVQNYTIGMGDHEFYEPLLTELKKLIETDNRDVGSGKGFYDSIENKITGSSDDLTAERTKAILQKLSACLFDPMADALRQKHLSPKELDLIFKEYTGSEKGTDELAKHLGYEGF
jgi:3-hydroxybutyryl-CoA dehydrogenase